MAKNEFQTIETYTKDLRALRYYSQLKEERDSLVAEVARLKEKVARLKPQLKRQASSVKALSSQLTKREVEFKELTGRLEEVQGEVSSLSSFKVKLPDDSELTLAEMREQFLHAEEEVIERKAAGRLRVLEKDMRRRMPTLVHKRLIQVLKQPDWPPEIAGIINSTARQIADDILGARDQWPDWFSKYYLDEVSELANRRLTAEFESRVEAEAEKHLELMEVEQRRDYAAAKAMMLATGLKDMLRELEGTWSFTCDSCGRQLIVNIGPSEIGSLLRGQTIDVVCTTCSDPAPFPFVLGIVPHKVYDLNLEGLLQVYIGNVHPSDEVQ